MILKHANEVPAQTVGEGAKGVVIRWLLGPDDAMPHFHMRRLEIEPGGQTPHHAHDWEHEVYILEGIGVVRTDSGVAAFAVGDVVYMPAGERHAFVNTGGTTVRMLCLVPVMKKS